MPIITISREMGTGAYKIAKEVAKKLRYTLVDGQKIAELASQYDLAPEVLERADEKPPAYITADDRLHASYLNTIELLLLRNVLRVRFIAPFDERVENFAEREWIDPDLARELIRKNDHQRGGFIHFYFDRDWNDPLGYDLVYNTSRLSESSIVESIVSAAKDPKLKQAEPEAAEMLKSIILCKRVETALLKSPGITNMHFKIEAQDGEVILSGHVHTEEERKCAVKIANSVEGVQRVEDNLQVLAYRSYK